jgi:transposase
VSTSTLGGHVNTIQTQAPVDSRRRRRLHSDEFKANAVASCTQPGMSMAAVAMANGVNANLLRRWVREAELRCGGDRPDAPTPTLAPPSVATPAFVPLPLPLPLPAKSMSPDIRIELRRGATAVTVTWPADAAAECAAWMRELLR